MDNINLREVLRYMGGRGEMPRETHKLIISCSKKMEGVLDFKYVLKKFPLRTKEDFLLLGPMEVKSENLRENLRGCREVFLLAATLGPGVDMLIRRAEVSSMTEAAALQALGAERIEYHLDLLNDKLKAEAAGEGLSLRPRFSPGYGDFSLSHQRDFMELLSMSKHLGISLSEGLLMTPSKSVTAVIGIAEENI